MKTIADTKDMVHTLSDSDEKQNDTAASKERDLFGGLEGQTYIVRDIRTEDDELNAFLFRLGCYSGEPITIISKKKKSCVVAIKDSRYTLDKGICEAIWI